MSGVGDFFKGMKDKAGSLKQKAGMMASLVSGDMGTMFTAEGVQKLVASLPPELMAEFLAGCYDKLMEHEAKEGAGQLVLIVEPNRTGVKTVNLDWWRLTPEGPVHHKAIDLYKLKSQFVNTKILNEPGQQ